MNNHQHDIHDVDHAVAVEVTATPLSKDAGRAFVAIVTRRPDDDGIPADGHRTTEIVMRRAIKTDRLFSSIVLWGPLGTEKTSLAMIIANTTQSHFETLSAVMAGVADIRRIVAEAKERRNFYGQRTTVLVDEIHRFNKTQQEALLPHT